MRSTMSHSSSVILRKLLSRTMPALLTTAWMPPNSSTHWVTSSCAPLRVPMSALLGTARPPAARISSTTFSASSPSTSFTTTPAPCAARWRQWPRPTPRPPPVITPAFPSRIPIERNLPPLVRGDDLGQLLGVLGAVAERVLEHPDALQVVVRGNFPGISHAAVHLDARARVLHRGVSRDHLRRRHRALRRAARAVVERRAGGVARRAAGLLRRVAVGEDVLDSLEAADRAVELLALLRVLGGDLLRALGNPEQQRCGECAALEPEPRRRRGVGDAIARGQRVD